MKADLRRVLVVCVAVVFAAVIVGASSAGKRGPEVVKTTFDAFPGPGEVTYGEKIAYQATLKNDSGTTLTHVIFRQRFPEIKRGAGAATPLPVAPTADDSSCDEWGGTASTTSVVENGVSKQWWNCDLGQRSANALKITLTVVWNVPVPTPAEASVNCDGCLTSLGRWTVKEGLNDGTAPNDTFGTTLVPATLLAKAGSGEKLKAGGYETASATCGEGEDIDTEAAGNLHTTPLGADNFLTTTICLPTINLSDADKQLGLGYAAKITEASNSRSAKVCIAALGVSCDATVVNEADFGDADVVHIFHIATDGLQPKNYQITTVTHDGHPLQLCSVAGAQDDEFGCVIKIVPPKGNQKFWIIVAQSPTNGLWGW